ncbi:MAG: hypothetical protein QOH68_2586, partial [Nocardioidaceae bacterium]|nr:hypothetical protein [Nocardioidaceae bacterium]
MLNQASLPVAAEVASTTDECRGVGDRRERVDAVGRVRGTITYTADEAMGDCAHVGVHRSTRPHALLKAVHVDGALAMDGVLAVVTGADLHAVLGDRMVTGPAFQDQPAMAFDRVRYLGEPIAAVLARDLTVARAAADAIWVEYDDLVPVYGLDDALAEVAFVHDELRPSAVFGDLR